MRFALARKSGGFSLIEVLVAFVILILLSGALYRLLNSARHTTSSTIAKGEVKGMVEIILRAMERDISTSHAVVTAVGNGKFSIDRSFQLLPVGWPVGGCTMLVPEIVPETKKTTYKRVEYLYEAEKRTLIRNDASGSRRILCENVDMLVFHEATNTSPLIDVEVKVSLIPPGSKVPQFHHQKLVINIRQAREANLDPRWREPSEINEEKY